MSEVSSAMWCEYDDDSDSDAAGEKGGVVRGEAANSHSGGGKKERLRISVQTLDGHICDDEDEDSETDDGDSDTDCDETDRENETDEDGSSESRILSIGLSKSGRRKRKASDARVGSSRRAIAAKGDRKAAVGVAGRKWSKAGEEELDDVGCRRKEELASVLRKLRAAIRLMDGILTEEQVALPRFADVMTGILMPSLISPRLFRYSLL